MLIWKIHIFILPTQRSDGSNFQKLRFIILIQKPSQSDKDAATIQGTPRLHLQYFLLSLRQ